MKKISVLFLLLLPLLSVAQQVPVKKSTEVYCMVVATRKLLSTKVNIAVDYGQETKMLADTRLKDEAGRVIAFNSVIDALNFMSQQGWLFVNAYTIADSGTNVYHYVMKREVKTE